MTVRRLGLVLPLLLVFVLAISPKTEAQTLAQVFDVDDAYTKSLPTDQAVSFIWMVYNRDASDVLLRTQVGPDGGSGWSAGLSPRSAILEPGGSTEVNLTVSAGPDATEESVAFTVSLTFARAGDPAVNETIVQRLREAGIEIPPPQMAVTLGEREGKATE